MANSITLDDLELIEKTKFKFKKKPPEIVGTEKFTAKKGIVTDAQGRVVYYEDEAGNSYTHTYGIHGETSFKTSQGYEQIKEYDTVTGQVIYVGDNEGNFWKKIGQDEISYRQGQYYINNEPAKLKNT